MRINSLKVLLLTIFMIGCSNTNTNKPRDFDYGHLEQDRYINSFFEFEITIPDKWLVQILDERSNSETIKKINSNLNKPTKPSDGKTKILLSAYQYKLDSVVDYNPQMVIIAEDIMDSPADLNSFDYLLVLKDKLLHSNVKYNHIDSVLTSEIINDIGFYKMDANAKLNGLLIKQSYYSMLKDRHILLIVLNYVTDDQKEILKKSINSIKHAELKK